MANLAQSAAAPLSNNPALNITGPDNGLNLSNTIQDYQQQNLSTADVFSLSASIPQTLGGIPGLSMIPSLSKIPIPGVSQLTKLLSPFNNARFGVNGNWTPNHYATDLNNHFPKSKFLFKVAFYGFPQNQNVGAFYFYVHRCDKPKVRANHVDVNYYNFRTRVLTSVIYEPLAITFLDESGDTVNEFFKNYMAQISGTAQGNYGIDRGWGPASSSLPYNNGYASKFNQRIILEQVFPMLKGTTSSSWMANRFIFINPRIESFDFDEVSHEDSSSGSMATITFSYDAIFMDTVNDVTLYSWGQTDIMHGGGTSGQENAGQTAPAKLNVNAVKTVSKATAYSSMQNGADALLKIPSALGGLVAPTLGGIGSTIGVGAAPNSEISTVTQGTQTTLNVVAGGSVTPTPPLQPTSVKI